MSTYSITPSPKLSDTVQPTTVRARPFDGHYRQGGGFNLLRRTMYAGNGTVRPSKYIASHRR